jgi:hypothetical protein
LESGSTEKFVRDGSPVSAQMVVFTGTTTTTTTTKLKNQWMMDI